MRTTRLTEARTLLEAIELSGRTPETIEESIASSILKMDDAELVRLARKAHHRGFLATVDLIHAEFIRRREPALAPA